MDLKEFYSELGDNFDGKRIPLGIMEVLLGKLNFEIGEIGEHLIFGEEGYRRNLIQEGEGYQVLALCWKGGQRSPIHDHVGSNCAVKILKGDALETVCDILLALKDEAS